MAGTLAPLDERAEEQYIVDADFHLDVPVERLTGYIDSDTIRRKLEKYGTPGTVGLAGVKAAYAGETDVSPAKAHGQAITTEEILAVCAETGADEVVVQPTPSFVHTHGRYPTVDTATVRAYNDYLVDHVIDPEAGVHAGLLLPVWDVEAAVAEVERHGDREGMVAAANWLPSYRLPGDHAFDPIYDAITALDLPLLFHIGVPVPDATNMLEESKRTWTEHIVSSAASGVTDSVLNMVMTGLFEKYPDLEVVLSEAGVNWLPYVAYRADEFYQTSAEDVCLSERMLELDKQYLDRLPSEYIFDNMYVTTQPVAFPRKRGKVRSLLEATEAAEMYLFSTDWPHNTVDAPNWLFDTPGIDEETRERIFHENAASVFGW